MRVNSKSCIGPAEDSQHSESIFTAWPYCRAWRPWFWRQVPDQPGNYRGTISSCLNWLPPNPLSYYSGMHRNGRALWNHIALSSGCVMKPLSAKVLESCGRLPHQPAVTLGGFHPKAAFVKFPWSRGLHMGYLWAERHSQELFRRKSSMLSEDSISMHKLSALLHYRCRCTWHMLFSYELF